MFKFYVRLISHAACLQQFESVYIVCDMQMSKAGDVCFKCIKKGGRFQAVSGVDQKICIA